MGLPALTVTSAVLAAGSTLPLRRIVDACFIAAFALSTLAYMIWLYFTLCQTASRYNHQSTFPEDHIKQSLPHPHSLILGERARNSLRVAPSDTSVVLKNEEARDLIDLTVPADPIAARFTTPPALPTLPFMAVPVEGAWRWVESDKPERKLEGIPIIHCQVAITTSDQDINVLKPLWAIAGSAMLCLGLGSVLKFNKISASHLDGPGVYWSSIFIIAGAAIVAVGAVIRNEMSSKPLNVTIKPADRA
ncbi:hypothetical protein FRC12_004503 [Ceratobasidium sp. 428]|nr:hypothetical protein FRC12_004503 [Ceratobasidium sp. 428]